MQVGDARTGDTGHRAGRGGLRLALLAFAQFVVALDYNIVYVALPEIGRALGFSAQSLQWVVSAYAVGFGGFLLLGGRITDRLGARRVFVIGLLLFGLSCLVGGFAGGPAVLVAARAAQGLGAALLSPATLKLINTTFAEGAARNRALAVWGASGSGGLAAGALLGGVLTSALGWQSVLWVLVPLALGAAAAAPALLPATRRPGSTGGFDLAGAVLATAASSLLVLGLVSGPQAGWVSLSGLGALVGAAVLFALLVVVESRTRDPLIPLRLLGNRSLVTAMLVILVFQSALGGGYYIFTTFLQNVLRDNALRAGLAFLPLAVIAMLASLKVTGALIARWGTRTTLCVGMLINGVGLGVLAIGLATDASYLALLPGVLIWGFGGGVTFPAMFISAGSGVAPAEQGVASALATTAQQVGGAIGLAALVAVANAGLAAEPSAAAQTGGLRLALLVAAIGSVVGGLLVLAVKPPAPRSIAERAMPAEVPVRP